MLLAAELSCCSGDLQDGGVGGRWESALLEESAPVMEVVEDLHEGEVRNFHGLEGNFS